MKRVLVILILLLAQVQILAEDFTLKAGVSIDDIPKALFGSWRVIAKIEDTNSYKTFKPNSCDIWNLSRIGDKITLSNPFSGANAEVLVQTIEGNLIVFSKKAPYDNKILTDTITIRLNENSFSGINDLRLESFSLVDNHLLKTEQARYRISGEKISGDSVLKLDNE